jgi:hypothetical protein
MTHSHKTHAELTQCALSFGECWQTAKGQRNKQNNKPFGSHPEDIKN